MTAGTGARRWTHTFPHSDHAPPVVYRNLVYVGVGGEGNERVNSLYALDLSTGRTVWRRTSSVQLPWTGVIGAGKLFTSLGNAEPVVALDLLSGRTIWSRSSIEFSPYFGMTYDHGRLYVPSHQQGCTTSLSAADGSGLLLYACGSRLRPAVVSAGVVYTADDGGGGFGSRVAIRALPTGCTAAPCRSTWTTQLTGDLGTAISVGRGKVYVPMVVNDAPVLQVLDAATGRLLWTGGGLEPATSYGSHDVSVAGNVAYLTFGGRQELAAYPASGCGRSTCLPLTVLRLGSSSSGGRISAAAVAEGTAAITVGNTGTIALRTD